MSFRALSFAPLLFLVGCSAAPSTPVCVAGAKLGPQGYCETQRAPLHHVPFRAGYETKVVQGFHGFTSHKDDLAYAIDFRCDVGTPVTASRSGRVWAVREDSNTGCADPRCVDQANYVILDHGDGTFTEYYHLMQHGALVEEGEHVCMGEIIGMCGNTGYSSGPHLHFAVVDATRRTQPVQLAEGRSQFEFGFPIPDTEVVSQNRRRPRCRDVGHSRLGEDAFAHHGVIIDQELSTVVHAGRSETVVEGTYYGAHPRVAVHRRATKGGSWRDECVRVDEDGDFEIPLTWPGEHFSPGTYWLMITGADEECLAPGWAWSYKIRVR